MLWQCRSCYGHEDTGLGVADFLQTLSRTNGRQKLNMGPTTRFESLTDSLHKSPQDDNFWDVATGYSNRNLTRPSDKLPAIAGIVEFCAIKACDIPLVGLWKKTIARDLSWRCEKEQGSTLPGIPAWSWLSSTGKIRRPFSFIPEVDHQLELDYWCIKWKHQDFTSKLLKATLHVRSQIFESALKSSDSQNPIRDNFREVVIQNRWTMPATLIDHDHNVGNDTPLALVNFSSDTTITACEGSKVTYLLLYVGVHPDASSAKNRLVVFLALRQAPGNPGAFIRLGCGVLSVKRNNVQNMLKDWKVAVVQLC